jgi:hypothetical protein
VRGSTTHVIIQLLKRCEIGIRHQRTDHHQIIFKLKIQNPLRSSNRIIPLAASHCGQADKRARGAARPGGSVSHHRSECSTLPITKSHSNCPEFDKEGGQEGIQPSAEPGNPKASPQGRKSSVIHFPETLLSNSNTSKGACGEVEGRKRRQACVCRGCWWVSPL